MDKFPFFPKKKIKIVLYFFDRTFEQVFSKSIQLVHYLNHLLSAHIVDDEGGEANKPLHPRLCFVLPFILLL